MPLIILKLSYLKGVVANICNVGVEVTRNRGFSLYDIEQFLKDAGAEKVNERAIICLEKELRDTVDQLLEGATMCANHAGRSKRIRRSDVKLAKRIPHARIYGGAIRRKRHIHKGAPNIILRSNVIGQHAAPLKVQIQ